MIRQLTFSNTVQCNEIPTSPYSTEMNEVNNNTNGSKLSILKGVVTKHKFRVWTNSTTLFSFIHFNENKFDSSTSSGLRSIPFFSCLYLLTSCCCPYTTLRVSLLWELDVPTFI